MSIKHYLNVGITNTFVAMLKRRWRILAFSFVYVTSRFKNNYIKNFNKCCVSCWLLDDIYPHQRIAIWLNVNMLADLAFYKHVLLTFMHWTQV